MTLDTSLSKAVFKGNGVATEFPFHFKVWSRDQLSISIAYPNGKEKSVTPESVTLTDTGGTIFYTLNGKPLPIGYTLSITRAMPFVQQDNYISGTRFDPEVIEESLDVACAERQELKEIISRCIKVGVASGMTPEQLLEAIFHARDQILAGLIFAGNTTGATMVVADGTTTPRSISDRFADIINVKDFGAKGDGVTDDTESIQRAIDRVAVRGGGIVYVPAGKYIQCNTIIIKNRVRLIGDGDWLTIIQKSDGMNKDAVVSDNFDDLKDIDDQQNSPLFPRDFGIIGITFQGRYLSGDVTAVGNSYINTNGGGIKIIGSRYTLDCTVLNQAGIGVFLQAKGEFNQSDKVQNSTVRLNINTCKYECLIFDGPADIFIDAVYAGNAGSTNVPGAGDVAVASPIYGTQNGGLCDNVVFATGAEIGFLHAWGTYHGVGVRCLSGRLNADFIISESNQCGHFVSDGDSRGSITKILCHGGGGGGSLRPNRGNYPDIYINTTNGLSWYIGSIYMYCRSNVDNGQDKIVIDSSFVYISDIRIDARSCSGDGLVINGSYCGFDNIHINNISGTNYEGYKSAAIVRNATNYTFFTRLNAMVITVPVAFRSKGVCRTEDILIFYALKEFGIPFEGDRPLFGYNQNWNIRGTIDGTKIGTTKFKTRIKFDPTITTEQILTVDHDLIVTPNISDVLLTMQDVGVSLNSGMVQYMYVKETTNTTIKIVIRMKEPGNASDPYITVVADIS